jgi:hypothetical protein
MTAPEPRIVIALRPGPPIPSGELKVAGQSDRPFLGWLDLLSALGEAVDRHSGPSADGNAPDSPRAS